MTGHRSELDVVAIDEQAMPEHIVEGKDRRFAPLTRFDYAFVLLRHRLGLKVNPQLLVQIEDPRTPTALNGQDLHQYRGAGVEAVRGSRRDIGIAGEGIRKFHRFAPVFLADIEAPGRDSGKVSP